MGYIRVKYQRLLSELDRTSWLPDGFKKFVNEKTTSHNLIFKGAKSVCKCGNCGFEFNSKTKVNNYEKCPNCNNTYLVKRNCLNYYEFKDYFSLFDVRNIIKHNIDYTIDKSFYIKNIDKYVIDGEILTLNKKIRALKKNDIMKLTKLASSLLETKKLPIKSKDKKKKKNA